MPEGPAPSPELLEHAAWQNYAQTCLDPKATSEQKRRTFEYALAHTMTILEATGTIREPNRIAQ